MKDFYDIVWNEWDLKYEVTHVKTRMNRTAGFVVLDVPGYSQACKVANGSHPRVTLPTTWNKDAPALRWEKFGHVR